MTDALSNALAALVVALIPIIGLYARQYAKTKLTPARLSDLATVARAAVVGVEKEFGDGSGDVKYQKAASALADAAKTLGLNLSDDLASALIHASLDEVEKMAALTTSELNSAIDQAYRLGAQDALAGADGAAAA